MKCVRCGRPMREARAISFMGPVGPKCAAAMGLNAKAKQAPRVTRQHYAPIEVDPRQMNFFNELESAL